MNPPFSAAEQEAKATILRLQLPTDPRWVNLAEMQLSDILTDHAYCEQKAASTCISMIQLFPEYEELVEELSPIVTEEWGHFRMVLKEMKKRNIALGKQRKDHYVNQLRDFVKKGVSKEDKLLDLLLLAGLIEARSCERFKLLSEGLAEKDLREFYRKLMIAEAGHYTLFLNLARKFFGKERTKKRWMEWLQHEKKVISKLDARGDRMH